MSTLLHSLVFLLPLVTSTPIDRDQPLFRLGPTIGAALNIHRTERIFPTGNLQDQLIGDCYGYSGRFGIVAEYQWNRSWKVTAQLDYAVSSTQYRRWYPPSELESFEIEYDSGITYTPSTTLDYNVDVTHPHIDLALMASRSIIDNDSTFRIGIAVGPTITKTLESDVRSTLDIYSTRSENLHFVNAQGFPSDFAGRRLIVHDGDMSHRAEWRLGVRAGVVSEFGSSKKGGTLFSPGIYYEYALTSLTKEHSWKIHSLMARLDVKVGL